MKDIQYQIDKLAKAEAGLRNIRSELLEQVADLDSNIQTLNDTRGGLILYLEQHHGITPK